MTSDRASRHRSLWGGAIVGAVIAASASCRPAQPRPGAEWVAAHRFSWLESVALDSAGAANDGQLRDQLAFLKSLSGGRPVEPELDAETCELLCQGVWYDDEVTQVDSCRYAAVVAPPARGQRVVVCIADIDGHWDLPPD